MRMNVGRWERIGSVAAGAALLYIANREARRGRTATATAAGLMVRMAVRDQHAGERPSAKRALEGDKMLGRSHAGVDERRLRALDQPRVVPSASHRTRVRRVHQDGVRA